MDIQKITETDDFNAIGEIYAQSRKTAYQGIVPQDYLDGLAGSRWAEELGGSKCCPMDADVSDDSRSRTNAAECLKVYHKSDYDVMIF